jgi:hypothetical protein
MLTAVVASVATAFPHNSGETLLVLLSSPDCIMFDKMRLVGESHTTSGLSARIPLFQANKKIGSSD